jgi:hypothetical protein
LTPKKTVRHLKRVRRAVAEVGATSARAGELGVAAGKVVAHRVGLGLAALANPLDADHAEFARMVPEKTEAFTAAGTIMLERTAAIGQRIAAHTMKEAMLAGRAGLEMAATADPASLLRVQSRFLAGAASRFIELAMQVGGMSLAIGGAALVPVHRTATANARRIG